jgi:hypothetical protein
MEEEIHNDLIVKCRKHIRKLSLLRETMLPIDDLAQNDQTRSAYLTELWRYCPRSAGRQERLLPQRLQGKKRFKRFFSKFSARSVATYAKGQVKKQI